jgi:hypothetical protein
VSIFENKASIADVTARVDQAAALHSQSNTRLAAILNALEIAKAHGGHKNWSDSHAEALRAMISICDHVATGSEPHPRITSF